MNRICTILCLAVFATTTASAATWATIDVPGALATTVYGLNSGGDLVGSYDDSQTTHCFRLSAGVYTTIDVPGSLTTYCTGINDLGQIAGSYQDAQFVHHGFLLDGATFTTIDPPGSLLTVTGQINNSTQIAGFYIDATHIHGFKWDNGLFTVIDDLAGTDSEALGINNKGDIGGFYFKQDGTESGFVRINGSDRDFVYPGSAGTEVWAINDRRQVAGGAFTNSGRSVGFSFAGGRFQALRRFTRHLRAARAVPRTTGI